MCNQRFHGHIHPSPAKAPASVDMEASKANELYCVISTCDPANPNKLRSIFHGLAQPQAEYMMHAFTLALTNLTSTMAWEDEDGTDFNTVSGKFNYLLSLLSFTDFFKPHPDTHWLKVAIQDADLLYLWVELGNVTLNLSEHTTIHISVSPFPETIQNKISEQAKLTNRITLHYSAAHSIKAHLRDTPPGFTPEHLATMVNVLLEAADKDRGVYLPLHKSKVQGEPDFHNKLDKLVGIIQEHHPTSVFPPGVAKRLQLPKNLSCNPTSTDPATNTVLRTEDHPGLYFLQHMDPETGDTSSFKTLHTSDNSTAIIMTPADPTVHIRLLMTAQRCTFPIPERIIKHLATALKGAGTGHLLPLTEERLRITIRLSSPGKSLTGYMGPNCPSKAKAAILNSLLGLSPGSLLPNDLQNAATPIATQLNKMTPAIELANTVSPSPGGATGVQGILATEATIINLPWSSISVDETPAPESMEEDLPRPGTDQRSTSPTTELTEECQETDAFSPKPKQVPTSHKAMKTSATSSPATSNQT